MQGKTDKTDDEMVRDARNMIADQLRDPATKPLIISACEALRAGQATPQQQVVACIAIALAAAREIAGTDDELRMVFEVMLRGSRT